MSDVVRTPNDRFENLPDYGFDSNYLLLEDGLLMHYLDEGDKSDPVILLLHGEPSWSFLYRKMIPILTEQGFRAVAPDLIGFGKSDKPTDQNAYSYQGHIDWVSQFIKAKELSGISLFCQDWGGLIGLRVVASMKERFDRVIASNTTLPTGNNPMPEAFMKWRQFSQKSEKFNIGMVIQNGTLKNLSEEVIQAYNAPYPSEEYKAGARVFPVLVPVDKEDPEARKNVLAWKELMSWEKPFLTLYGNGDPIMKGAEKAFQKVVPGAYGRKHKLFNAGHFIQEEQGEELAAAIVEFCQNTQVI